MMECRSEMERGLVPNYKKYGTHVLASVLKDYLRSIPGKILLSGNYDLWIKEVVDEPDHEKKIVACRNLLSLLPTSHWILLGNLLKLLNRISSSPSSKMSASALSVCLAPSFLDPSVQPPDPMESGKKIPLLVEFLILNVVEVTPPGFSADNVFSILNPVDHNANHLYSPVPTCSDDDSSQQTPIIEEMGVNSPALSVTRDDLPPERPLRLLRVISENDEILSFSDSEDEPELIQRPPSRASFRSETLRQQNEPSLTKEEGTPERTVLVSKVDERKQPDTPRSPCLKRIHFQRKQEQVQQRSTELLKYDTRIDKVERQNDEKIVLKDDPPPRKESREEATQTSYCCLPRIGDFDSTFQAFYVQTTHPAQSEDSPANPHIVRREAIGVDSVLRSTVKDAARNDETQKPTVHVHPFTPDPPSQEPILRTIAERLQSLCENHLIVESTSPRFRRSFHNSDESARFRHSCIDVDKSPRFLRKFGESNASPMSIRRAVENHVLRDDMYSQPFKRQEVHSRFDTNASKQTDPQIITERFSSYCIEPRIDDQFKNDSPTKRLDLTRSFSHRGDKNAAQRDVHRATSVKACRRSETCVGMESLEINWSVRQLKTLFQDAKAPSINTDYTTS
ncbi:hypothetical protein KIN20_009314 [Parelaphostrongylus tenuis]|uniref:Rho-GAP domain-containing protein n=1 Tax=Parelaphostrongylus tenuis TaxID=148309 RepID=A0AAD5MQD0_PARTN|nr:hypothetical protein KIN20_009314 [Parelaphostrongylus tenuis]